MKNIGYRLLLAASVAGLLTLGSAQSQSSGQGQSGTQDQTGMQSGSQTGKMSMSDKKFAKEAAQGGVAEVELGQLAAQKASSDDVKKFGQRMVDDHSKANDKLKQLASSKGINLPTDPDASQKATKNRLSKLSGEQFDKAYMREMLKDHKKDVAAFESESNKGQDPDLKSFATETLPTLRDHLKDAQSIAPKVTQAQSTEPKTTSH
jgi:putative membrane protein